MEIKIQAIKFDATDKLEAFVEKKVSKLERPTTKSSRWKCSSKS